MKIVFMSNFLNHHQYPLARELYNILGDEYHWISTEPMDEEKINMGYNEQNSLYPFALRTYESDEEKKRALELAYECDILIVSYDVDDIISRRLKDNKITVFVSERFFKKSDKEFYKPRLRLGYYKRFTRYRNKPLYMLAIGKYAYEDAVRIGLRPERIYKWAYFIDVPGNLPDKDQTDRECINILWASRFIGWKHPEFALQAAKKLKDIGVKFRLDMLGCGELEQKSVDYADENGLSDAVIFHGSVNQTNVAGFMQNADIFIQTSDRNEGWGAVISEAMANSCAVVASEMTGASSVLIENGVNGVLFKDNDYMSFENALISLANNRNLIKKYGDNAQKTMSRIWNPGNAANKLLMLCDNLLYNNKMDINEGPCSNY